MTQAIRISLLIAFSFWGCSTYAQNNQAKNTLYLEISGWGHLSFNYDRLLWQKNAQSLRLAGGAFLFPNILRTEGAPFPSYNTLYWQVGSSVNYLLGTRRSKLEIGLNYNLVRYKALVGLRQWRWVYADPPYYTDIIDNTSIVTNHYHLIGLRIGYRYQKAEGGFMFKIGVMPMTWFTGSKQNYSAGMAHLLAAGQVNQRFVFLPVPDIGLGWSF
jgi:hypothetical protein